MKSKIIQGGSHTDHRGIIKFVNNFDLKDVRRFYSIHHPDISVIRAWQGHQYEAKYFYVIRGGFKIALIKPDNWENPSIDLPIETFTLNDKDTQILHVQGGYINGFKAIEPCSIIIVFSDKTLEESKDDDYHFPVEYWKFL